MFRILKILEEIKMNIKCSSYLADCNQDYNEGYFDGLRRAIEIIEEYEEMYNEDY